jgi:hypothetical protein
MAAINAMTKNIKAQFNIAILLFKNATAPAMKRTQ